jgi:molybdate transport system regulatory protein
MTSSTATRALLHLHKGPLARVGPERIRLLEAIAEHGSITAAAKAAGLSYKGAWDAVQALNNLFERPLISAQTGGRKGGGAGITPAGAAVLRAYKQVEAELANIMGQLEQVLATTDAPLDQLIWSLGMKTSARNALRGTVETVIPGAVNSEVILRIADGVCVVAIITKESVEDLGLVPGREAIALIKSSFVILAPAGEPLRTSARNKFEGVVIRHETGAVNDEVVLELQAGKTITATLTRESAEDLGLKVGERAQAIVKASHVILAVD